MNPGSNETLALTEYRTFRNTDPPQLAEVWRSQHASRGLMQPMSVALLERYVLSKPTFDREGLIVAAEADKLVGFAHAGFGPNVQGSNLCRERGITSLVLTRPDADPQVARELLGRAERYLLSHGASVLYGGGGYPMSPFYYGLYGGSEFSGVLDSDLEQCALFPAAGYRACSRSIILQRDLAGFRPVVDRQQMQIRRTTRLSTMVDPPSQNWWDAVMFEPFERTRWTLSEREGGPDLASVYVWSLETMTGAWGVHAAGIVDLVVPDEQRRRGLATNLLGETIRQLQAQGISLVEVHVPEGNLAAQGVFTNLGFQQVDASTVYCKP